VNFLGFAPGCPLSSEMWRLRQFRIREAAGPETRRREIRELTL